jgi:hypothetical protein
MGTVVASHATTVNVPQANARERCSVRHGNDADKSQIDEVEF